mgnify:CR=1 FL=1
MTTVRERIVRRLEDHDVASGLDTEARAGVVRRERFDLGDDVLVLAIDRMRGSEGQSKLETGRNNVDHNDCNIKTKLRARLSGVCGLLVSTPRYLAARIAPTPTAPMP